MSTAAKILLDNLIVVRLRGFSVATTSRTCNFRRLRDMLLHYDVCKKLTASAPWRGIPMAAAYRSSGGVRHRPGLAKEESASIPDANEIFIITRNITRHALYFLSCVGCQ